MAYNLFFSAYGGNEPPRNRLANFEIILNDALDNSAVGSSFHDMGPSIVSNRGRDWANELLTLGAKQVSSSSTSDPVVFEATYLGGSGFNIPAPKIVVADPEKQTTWLNVSLFLIGNNQKVAAAYYYHKPHNSRRAVKRAFLMIESQPSTWNSFCQEFPKP
jgi:hypothetical protein